MPERPEGLVTRPRADGLAAPRHPGEASVRLLVDPHHHRPVHEQLVGRPLLDETREELLGEPLSS